MFLFGLNIFLLCFTCALCSNACLSQTPCKCVLPDNNVIDLSTVGSQEFARFYGIDFHTNCSETELYSYNPCFPFNSPDKETRIESGRTPCIGASACVKGPGGITGQLPEEHAIGIQNTAIFGLIGSMYYINYTAPGSKKNLRINLICNENATEHELDMVVPECSESNVIVLNLTSKCACAGGCKSSMPNSSSSGLSTGSKLLIAFFTIFLAYLIIGIVWNYCNGSQGINLIPNIEFWNELPTLIMEGIAFTCSCCVSNRSYGEV